MMTVCSSLLRVNILGVVRMWDGGKPALDDVRATVVRSAVSDENIFQL